MIYIYIYTCISTQSQIRSASVRDAATITDSRDGTVLSVSSAQSEERCLAETSEVQRNITHSRT